MPGKTKALAQYADTLYRAATECHRQHTRHAKLVDRAASAEEQRAALEMAYLCDDFLGDAIFGYEQAKGHTTVTADEEWWHKANMLWHASKEYIRRHASSDGMSRRVGRQSPNRLAEFTMSFEIEASALLALRMAADSYRKARPEAE